MRKKILTGIAAIALLQGEAVDAQQALALDFFSQNGWMPDTIGGGIPYNAANCSGLSVSPQIPCICYGTLQQHWGKIKDSKARFIRYGGIGVDQNNPNNGHYLKFVDSVRARGMEPILQIPLNLGEPIGGTQAYDTTRAKAIINYINGTMGRNVTYWSIGNEPDHALPGGYGYDSAYQAIQITTYIKNFSKAMRRAVPGVPIKIMGPELAEWNCDAGYTKKKLVDSLLTPNQRCDITGGNATTGQAWIDYFSFHWYGGINGDDPSLPRATMIAKLRSNNNLAETLDTLNMKLAAANSYHNRTGSLALKSAITEAHIAYQGDSLDAFTDVKCNGFFAGQYWAELASIAAEKSVSILSYWSTVENSMGYMKFDGTKKSTYWHFKEMAKWFNGAIYIGTDNQPNIKAFGSKNGDYIAIMLLNQDTVNAAYRPYTINLNNTPPGTSNWITMPMGVSKSYVDSIDASSSTLLIFDLYGNIAQKYYYKQSDGSSQPGFHQRYNQCSSSKTYASQTALDAYVPGQYQDITLGDASGTNTVTVNSSSPNYDNSVYRATTSITLEKNFSSGTVGQTLDLIIDTDCQ